MHNTLKEIATHVRTIELPTPSINPETDSFYEDEPTEDQTNPRDEVDPLGYYQGRKIRDQYPTPPSTPPPAALLAGLMAGHMDSIPHGSSTKMTPQGSSKTIL